MTWIQVQHGLSEADLNLEKDGKVGYLQFDTDDRGWMTIWHTEVPPELRGHGIASDLVRTAFEYARDNQLHVDVICPVATTFAAKHPRVSSSHREKEPGSLRRRLGVEASLRSNLLFSYFGARSPNQ